MSDPDSIYNLNIRWSRTFRALLHADILTLTDLLAMSDRQRRAIPGIGRVGMADIEQALAKYVDEGLDALTTRRLPDPPAGADARGDEHPLDVAIRALRAAAESMPDDGYSGWRASFHRMADTLPDREWRERHWT